MTSPSEQRRLFDIAIDSYLRGGREEALGRFEEITVNNPTMSDAWLGRMACSGNDVLTAEGLYTNSRALYRETRRLGLADETLHAMADTTLYLTMPVWTRATAALAYVCALLAENRYEQAHQLLADEVIAADSRSGQWAQYLAVVLAHRTRRWPDVLAATAQIPAAGAGMADPLVTTAMVALRGTAQAALGDFDAALQTLDSVSSGSEPILADVALTRGWCLRERGEESQALNAFRSATVGGALLGDARRALDDPNFRLVVSDVESMLSRTDKWDPATETSSEQRSAAALDQARAEALAKAEAELGKLIGLDDAKEQIEVWRTEIQIDQLLAEDGSAGSSENHIVLQGPPGTAKTTFARIAVHILFGLGKIERDEIVEVSEEDVVSGFVSQTAGRMREVCEQALGGGLFIDEAYRLVPETQGHSFGKDAINTLLKFMEDHRDRFVVMVAGYRTEMKRFLAANPGLASRFHFTLDFNSYTPQEIVAIGQHLAAEEGIAVADPAWALLGAEAQRLRAITVAGIGTGLDEAGNGRYARKVVVALRRERARRLRGLSPAQLKELARSDRDELTVSAEDMRRALASAVSEDRRGPSAVSAGPECAEAIRDA